MLCEIFTAQDYAKEFKVSTSTARARLAKQIQARAVDSFIRYEDNPLKFSRINFGSVPPMRVRYYFFKKDETK